MNERLKNPKVASVVYDVKFEQNKNNKALYLINIFGDDLKNLKTLDDEQKILFKQLKNQKAFDKETQQIYEKLINK